MKNEPAQDDRRARSPMSRREVVEHAPPTWIAPMPVERWMRQPVVTIGLDTPVADAVTTMRERGIRHLPVVDGACRLVGIVTDRDLRHVILDVAVRGIDEAASPDDLTVREVMTWGVVTVRPATDLREAARIMRERRLGALPVVDAAGQVVGILTERDLIDVLQVVLRERVIRPKPAVADTGDTYDPGIGPRPADASNGPT
jgi:CBS domain-containing protein